MVAHVAQALRALTLLSFAVLSALLARALLLLRAIRARRRRIILRDSPGATRSGADVREGGTVLVVLGSGGHTAEMLSMLTEWLPTRRARRLVYVVGETDAHSRRKALATHRAGAGGGGGGAMRFCVMPRAREVGEGAASSVLSVLRALCAALTLVWRERPTLVLCNGPANAAVVATATFVMRVLRRCEGRVVFVESFARVNSLSVSGRVLLLFADRFIVQWAPLKRRYALCEFYGRLC